MFGKIKDLVEMSRIIDQIGKRIDNNSRSIDELEGTVKSFSDKMDGLMKDIQATAKERSDTLERFKKDADEISVLKDDLKSAIYDISVFRKDALSELLKRFDQTIRYEIEDKTKDLKLGSEHYRRLSEDILKIAQRTVQTQEVLDKMIRIGNRIREGDFELGNFANQMRKAEGEKMALLRKIDSLERLVSRLRIKAR